MVHELPAQAKDSSCSALWTYSGDGTMTEPKTAEQLNAPFVGQLQWRDCPPIHANITPILPELKCSSGETFEFHVWASADAKEGDPCKCGKVKLVKV